MKNRIFTAGLVGYILLSSLLVYYFPQSVLAFLAFEASLLLIYYAPVSRAVKLSLAAATLVVVLPLIGTINGYYLEIAIQVGIFVALALGLNIVVGFAGLLNLGYVAFYAIGAYLWAIFGSSQANEFISGGYFPLSQAWFFVFLLLSIAAGALTGALLGLPVLRLRGDYLAIVTLGFAEVVRALVNNLDKPINLTNGPRGITPIERPPLFFQPLLEGLGVAVDPAALYPLYFYFIVLLLLLAIILVTRRLEDSPVGRAWKAIRGDEIAAVAMGIPVVRMKLLAFAVGASFASAVGVLFAAKQVFINPESFTFMESIGVLAMVILGGMGSIPGAILGATAVTILNLQLLKGLSLWLNALRQSGLVLTLPLIGSLDLSRIPSQFEPAKYERMIFGLILILMMIFRPRGILPPQKRERRFDPSTSLRTGKLTTGGDRGEN
ncbi:MAG: branched-chain amino acid ABC transporter permease [Deltaproteobacteria bacterium RIFCSPLOWO2_12_FULL_60_19]|nr:MAG: branched-chain amino acid ABC transporter permease [Deltaproteobacteria bacterium RIFCSPLOWO2_12_FULL_60_19]